MSLPVLEVWHDRPNCIACGACAAVSANWIMDSEDGLASVVSPELDDSMLAENEEAAVVCPVNIIHLAKPGEVPSYFSGQGITKRPSGKRE